VGGGEAGREAEPLGWSKRGVEDGVLVGEEFPPSVLYRHGLFNIGLNGKLKMNKTQQ
jgi:hypothetical protein